MTPSHLLPILLAIACSASPAPDVPHDALPAAPTPAAHTELPASGSLPSDSVYGLQPTLVDQHGRAGTLDTYRGHPVIISMFYASCPNACPMLIADIRALERSLSDADRADLRVVLVSLDPERDTPALLAEVVARHGLDDSRWSLFRPEPADVREVAAALGIRYRPTSNGEMNHSSVLTLLDVEGRPVARLEGLQRDPQPLRDALAAARHPAPPR